jgi:hypothetical protein
MVVVAAASGVRTRLDPGGGGLEESAEITLELGARVPCDIMAW